MMILRNRKVMKNTFMIGDYYLMPGRNGGKKGPGHNARKKKMMLVTVERSKMILISLESKSAKVHRGPRIENVRR